MEKLENGKMLLKEDEYIPKKLGRKFLVYAISAIIMLVAFLISSKLNIDSDKLEVLCKWTTISGLGYSGTNASIDGIAKIASAFKAKNCVGNHA